VTAAGDTAKETPSGDAAASQAAPVSDEFVEAHALQLRDEQTDGSVAYEKLWGAEYGAGIKPKGGFSKQEIGTGLQNPQGEYHCFVNVLIQALWQFAPFRDELLAIGLAQRRLASAGNLPAPPAAPGAAERLALLRSLTTIFAELDDSHRAPSSSVWALPRGTALGALLADPTDCHVALGRLDESNGRARAKEMSDAAEALQDVLEALGRCLGEIDQSGLPPDSSGKELVAETFGLKVTERMHCTNCNHVMPELTYTKFFHLASVSLLAEMQREAQAPLVPEELFRRAYATELRSCSKCSANTAAFGTSGSGAAEHLGVVPFCSEHTLHTAPAVFCLQLVWDSGAGADAGLGRPEKQDIAACLARIPLAVDLAKVYAGLPAARYRLRALVCYYAKHYVLIAFRPRICKWVLLEDTLATVRSIARYQRRAPCPLARSCRC